MGEVLFQYVPSAENIADCLTKALPGPAFIAAIDAMMGYYC